MQAPGLPFLSATARRLLRGHRPGVPAYRAWELGRAQANVDLAPIDAAYAELVVAGLMESAGPVAEGASRAPFLLTPAGEQVRHLARR